MRLSRLLTPLIFALAFALGMGPAMAARPPLRAAASQPVMVYASVYGAGVFEGADLTAPWQGPASLPSDVLALAAGDPDHWRTVYAGLRYGGVYMSNDSGTSWKPTTLRGRTVYALVVDAHDPNTVLAGTDRGVFRTVDGGAAWTQSAGITRTVTALTPITGSSSLYAGGTGHVWLSADGGLHWAAMGRGLPGRAAVAALAVSMFDPSVVFAATSRGLWEQTGGIWKAVRGSVPGRAFTGISTDSSNVYAVSQSDAALYASADNGATWSRHAITGLQGGVTQLAPDAQQAGTLVIGGTDGSVWYSTDGGASWAASSDTVAGTVGSPILALALVQRRPLPVDGVADPHLPGVQWFPASGSSGHTARGAFLSFYQAHASLLGAPLTEEFADRDRGGMRAQYFQNMELVQQGDKVVPAPLGLEAVPAAYAGAQSSYAVDPHFQSFVTSNGGTDVFGPPVSPAFRQATDDGTGRLYLVQYFRNARLEYHPEAQSAGRAVQVSALGRAALRAKGWL